MSMEEPRQKKALAVRPASPHYEVGYGRPPVETRFKPGQSGNPRGRPKGSKNRPRPPALNEERLKAIVIDEAYRMVAVNDVKGPVAIPMAQAVIRSLAVNAAKGNQRAQRLFTELLASVETAHKRLHDEWLQTAIEYKVDWDRELERRARLGITAPDPVPHPDDIVINMRTGSVEVKGPMTKEEKVIWDRFRERKKDCDEEIQFLTEMLEKDPANRFIQEDLAQERRIRAIICKAIPD
jgi:hypothetical protein